MYGTFTFDNPFVRFWLSLSLSLSHTHLHTLESSYWIIYTTKRGCVYVTRWYTKSQAEQLWDWTVEMFTGSWHEMLSHFSINPLVSLSFLIPLWQIDDLPHLFLFSSSEGEMKGDGIWWILWCLEDWGWLFEDREEVVAEQRSCHCFKKALSSTVIGTTLYLYYKIL